MRRALAIIEAESPKELLRRGFDQDKAVPSNEDWKKRTLYGETEWASCWSGISAASGWSGDRFVLRLYAAWLDDETLGHVVGFLRGIFAKFKETGRKEFVFSYGGHRDVDSVAEDALHLLARRGVLELHSRSGMALYGSVL
jgi:hypothetical protein